ncbi:MAG TPA: diguanylate cyclase, partial [Chthonomonadaceae bacterium]|nr:diguanylate cyclase [Chthonomonadaceae bacterium]
RLYLNRALRELLGIPAGQVDDGVMESAHTAESLENLRTTAIPTAIRDGMWTGESTFLDRNGREVPVSQVVLAHRDASGACLYLSTIARDISESKEYARQMERTNVQLEEMNERLEAQKSELQASNRTLERLNSQLEALATTDCLTGLNNHRRFQETLRSEIERAARTGSTLSVLLLDVDEFKAYNDTYGHPAGDTVLKMLGDILRDTARSSDLVSRYGGEEFAIIVTDSDAEGAMFAAERFRVAIESAPWPERRITASFGVATQSAAANDPAALVALADSALYRSKNRGRNCITHVADQIGDQEMAEARLSPYAELLRTMQQLQSNTLAAATETIKETLLQSYDATVLSWARILALQDKETQAHTDRVAELIVRLGRASGMNEEEVLYAKWGALLHDIGKVAISDEILRKTGPLTGEEWEVVRRHPLTAYDMLSAISFLRPALDIPCHHHEKWDGTGYPAGLRADEIPFAARLFSIIDVYDALTSERPYRPAWPEREVRDYLRSQSGAHFDPRAVAVFLSMLEQTDAQRPDGGALRAA